MDAVNALSARREDTKVALRLNIKVRHLVSYWVPALTWMLVIFAASTDMMSAEHTSRFIAPFLRWLTPDVSVATIATVQLFVRKAAHLTEYAILGALLVRAFGSRDVRPAWGYAVVAWLLAVAWAGLDEFHQSFVSSRTGSPIDVMIDATGALIGLSIYWCFARKRREQAPVVAEQF